LKEYIVLQHQYGIELLHYLFKELNCSTDGAN